MLQCVAACCSLTHSSSGTSFLEIIQSNYAFAMCCSVQQRAAVCYSMLQCPAVRSNVLQCAAVCCSVLQHSAVCCSALQCASQTVQTAHHSWRESREFFAPSRESASCRVQMHTTIHSSTNIGTSPSRTSQKFSKISSTLISCSIFSSELTFQ